MEAEQFAYSMLTRSQRLSHENLRLRDPAYVARFEDWFASAPANRPACRCRARPRGSMPPMLTPFRVRGTSR
jgi:anthraniloyl-CoA monooxygenase